jgi:hypothetical protein
MTNAARQDFDFTDDAARKKRTNQLVRLIKSEGVDYEWYPTTQEQIEAIRADITKAIDPYGHDKGVIRASVLDIGAGDGRTLQQLTSGDKYAIEKSTPLVEAMGTDIFVIGSDFFESTLLDKRVDIVFCNPPYGMFEEFTKKIIVEANCPVIYLIIPCRWKESIEIKHALTVRKCEDDVSVIGTYDYYNADRQARAKVDIVKIEIGRLSYYRSCNNDPFDIWFDENFPMDAPPTAASEWVKRNNMEEKVKEAFAGAITTKRGVIPVLSELYHDELQKLMDTYRAITDIPYELVKELNISTEGVRSGLKLKIVSLKDVYWRKLFAELNTITDKLITDTREKLLNKLTSSTSVDFTVSNAANVVIWAIKQSNLYFEQQIVTIFERMTESANIELYKSNQRTIQNDDWRYTRRKLSDIGEYKLDYRIVLHSVGGYETPDYNCRGLCRSAVNLLDDLRVIARHLGFDVAPLSAANCDWEPGKAKSFYFFDSNNERHVLFEARAYKKGNIHLKLNEKFIQTLNVVHGRLKGWIKNASDAVREMDIPMEVAEQAFDINMRLGVKDALLLDFKKGE